MRSGTSKGSTVRQYGCSTFGALATERQQKDYYYYYYYHHYQYLFSPKYTVIAQWLLPTLNHTICTIYNTAYNLQVITCTIPSFTSSTPYVISIFCFSHLQFFFNKHFPRLLYIVTTIRPITSLHSVYQLYLATIIHLRIPTHSSSSCPHRGCTSLPNTTRTPRPKPSSVSKASHHNSVFTAISPTPFPPLHFHISVQNQKHLSNVRPNKFTYVFRFCIVLWYGPGG